MSSISNFPYFEVQFNKESKVHDPGQVQQLLDFLNQEDVTDLIAISHGWNTDMDEARQLYRNFLARMRQVIDGEQVPEVRARKFAIVELTLTRVGY